jgi:1-acyl-sn-glycerol-3-phosphate acyltransferase
MIRTLLIALYISLALLLVMPWLILWSWFSGSPDLMYRCAMSALRLADRMAGIRVYAEGVENIPPGVCIFVSNHASNMDPLALVPAIPRRVALLAKKEVFRIPILSVAMRQAGLVAVDRSDREAAAGSVDIAVQRLKNGLSFLVFAEGTRSTDGRLRPFKKGTFLMAIQAGVPMVPVSLIGTQNLMKKGAWALYPGEVIVRFSPAVDSKDYTVERRTELLARVEAAVAEGLPPEQRPLPS